jgi:tetratricopeptide (TPR) repeat protein
VLVSAHAWAGRIWRDEVGYWALAVARYPGEPAYYQSLGAARLRSGDAPGALRELSAALALDPELPRASYNLGIVYTTLGRDDEAMSAYQRAVASDASDVKAWANLGWLFERRGEIDQALVAYRAALAVAPDLARVRDRVAVLNGGRARGEPGHAVEGGAP